MLYRIAAIGFIFACTSVAWIILAEVVSHRTHHQDTKLKAAVGQLWGTPPISARPPPILDHRGNRRHTDR